MSTQILQVARQFFDWIRNCIKTNRASPGVGLRDKLHEVELSKKTM